MSGLIYLALSLAGLAVAVIAWFRTDRPADVAALFAIASAVITLADWVAYGILDLYSYQPSLLASSIADSAMGELLADLIFVPSFSVALVRFLPGIPGVVVGTALVGVLETTFLALGVFSHHGWSIWFSAIGFVVYFAVLDQLWQDLRGSRLPPANLRLVIRLCLIFDAIGLLTLLLRGQEWVVTQIAVMPTHLGNQSLGRFLTYVLITLPPGYWVLAGEGKVRWLRLGAVTVGFCVINTTLGALNIQRFIFPWNGVLDALAQSFAILLAGMADAWLVRGGVGGRAPVRSQ